MREQIATSVLDGKRINEEQALWALENLDLPTLGFLANTVRARKPKNGNDVVTYVISRNVNYTNVCITDCDFCSFYRHPKDAEAYSLNKDELREKARELVELGGTEVLLQGGHNPKLPLSYYQEMLSLFKNEFKLHNHAFSPSEIQHFAIFWRMTLPQVLKELKAAGLDSIPGGGAEILTDRVRAIICPKKGGADAWLEPMREAHKLGIRSSATMMFGHVETRAERIEHMRRLRELQDETKGFTAFICWTFQNMDNAMSHVKMVGAHEYLRTQAIARIYLDNFDNVQASWVTQGGKIGQISLTYGCNDMGSLMIEENVVRLAGATFRMNEFEIRRLIREAGYEPRRRNFYYDLLKEPADLDAKLAEEFKRERMKGYKRTGMGRPGEKDPTVEEHATVS
ncbi:MAG: dehypoxanthine futalosine cyclase [Planctomycetes bacterium]|nr:dehypoxanthine futalosine cyclase [Planctomycetota bacterium]NUQ34386.1 dehypoxanthine futalosine cyclase [Planctomycetaceae bacterium]